MCLHVDGAEFYSNSEYICWSLCSIFATDTVLDTKFPIMILPHESMQSESVRRHAHEVLARVVGWSLKCLSTSTFPVTGAFGEPLSAEHLKPNDRPISGGWRGVYFGFRGDEKARKEAHSFCRSYQHAKVCINCFAQRTHKDYDPLLNYKNFSRTAAHRMTRVSC